MGCDIHSIFQAKIDGKWKDVPTKYKGDRHYFLFAWLAGVRNGFGFAGIPTHTPIEPIAQPRGLPEGFTAQNEDGWLGDHPHSWLLANEILDAPPPTATMLGIISIEQYGDWDGKRPDSYCGDVEGLGIEVSFPHNITPTTSHVRVTWPERDGEAVKYFVDEVHRLRDKYGEVRFVFGFDS